MLHQPAQPIQRPSSNDRVRPRRWLGIVRRLGVVSALTLVLGAWTVSVAAGTDLAYDPLELETSPIPEPSLEPLPTIDLDPLLTPAPTIDPAVSPTPAPEPTTDPAASPTAAPSTQPVPSTEPAPSVIPEASPDAASPEPSATPAPTTDPAAAGYSPETSDPADDPAAAAFSPEPDQQTDDPSDTAPDGGQSPVAPPSGPVPAVTGVAPSPAAIQAAPATALSPAPAPAPQPTAEAPTAGPGPPNIDWTAAPQFELSQIIRIETVAETAPLALVAVPRALDPAVAVAVEFGRAGSGWAGTIAFNLWLRRQLRERRMSQRQLAAYSGVNHSTISRLLNDDRTPSLETATKLAHALRKLGGSDIAADYFDRLAEAGVFPTRRVQAALLADEELDDEDVQQLVQAYLAARARRRRLRAAAAGEAGTEGPINHPGPRLVEDRTGAATAAGKRSSGTT